MQDYKLKFIEFALDVGALKFGSFTLKSGRQSPYFFNAGEFRTGYALSKLSEFYAAAVAENCKYDDMVLYLLTYHGIICHQARDLFSAGSVANPKKDDKGGIYIERALKLIETEMREAALRMEDALFLEYWGENVAPEKRISRWLEKADECAKGWTPSASLFLDENIIID